MRVSVLSWPGPAQSPPLCHRGFSGRGGGKGPSCALRRRHTKSCHVHSPEPPEGGPSCRRHPEPDPATGSSLLSAVRVSRQFSSTSALARSRLERLSRGVQDMWGGGGSARQGPPLPWQGPHRVHKQAQGSHSHADMRSVRDLGGGGCPPPAGRPAFGSSSKPWSCFTHSKVN